VQVAHFFHGDWDNGRGDREWHGIVSDDEALDPSGLPGFDSDAIHGDCGAMEVVGRHVLQRERLQERTS